MIPGRALHRLASLICCTQTLDRVVEPAIADLQKEYALALFGPRSRRFSILFFGYAAILEVLLMCALETPPTLEEERKRLARVLAWSIVLVACTSALLIVPPLLGFSPVFRRSYAVLAVAPQAIPLAIPIGLAFGVAFGLSARPTINAAKMILLGAFSASLLSFVILAWGMPAGSRAFEELRVRELKLLGFEGYTDSRLREDSAMTLSELRAASARQLAQGEPDLARQFAFRFHFRFALAVAALALVCVLLASPLGNPGWRGLLAFSVCFAYWSLIYMGEIGSRRGYLPPLLGAWLPNLALVATAILVASSPSWLLRGSSRSAQ